MTSKNNQSKDVEFLVKLFSDEEDKIFEALDELDVDEIEWKEHNALDTTGHSIVSQVFFSVSTQEELPKHKWSSLNDTASENTLKDIKERSIDNYLFTRL